MALTQPIEAQRKLAGTVGGGLGYLGPATLGAIGLVAAAPAALAQAGWTDYALVNHARLPCASRRQDP